jgi:hypothetical protein
MPPPKREAMLQLAYQFKVANQLLAAACESGTVHGPLRLLTKENYRRLSWSELIDQSSPAIGYAFTNDGRDDILDEFVELMRELRERVGELSSSPAAAVCRAIVRRILEQPCIQGEHPDERVNHLPYVAAVALSGQSSREIARYEAFKRGKMLVFRPVPAFIVDDLFAAVSVRLRNPGSLRKRRRVSGWGFKDANDEIENLIKLRATNSDGKRVEECTRKELAAWLGCSTGTVFNTEYWTNHRKQKENLKRPMATQSEHLVVHELAALTKAGAGSARRGRTGRVNPARVTAN